MRQRFASSTDALTYLKRQRIRVADKSIVVKGQFGLTTWSAIDYLCNYHKHTWTLA